MGDYIVHELIREIGVFLIAVLAIGILVGTLATLGVMWLL